MAHNAWRPLKKVALCPPTHFKLQPINVIVQHNIDHCETGKPEIAQREHADFVQAEGHLLHLDIIVNIDTKKSWLSSLMKFDF